MKKWITYLLWLVVTFTGTTAGWCAEPGTTTDVSSLGPAKEVLHLGSITHHKYYFASQDWNIHNKQCREHIQLMSSGVQLLVRVVHGWDKCLQLICSSKNCDRLLAHSYLRFLHLYSYRQTEGYYIYHLRKILI